MKTRFLIIIGITLLAVSLFYVSFAFNQEIRLAIGLDQTGTKHYFPANKDNSIISDELQEILDSCNVWRNSNYNPDLNPRYELTNGTHRIDNNTCEWELVEKDPNPTQLGGPIIFDGFTFDDFDTTFGGLGNRHPAFLGYYIPEICTKDMVKHLVTYSSMFEKGVSYGIEEIGLPDSVDFDDFYKCVEILLENRDNEPSWPGR